jgi:aminomethyltransferase
VENVLKISEKRFKRSPFFNCYHSPEVVYGVYNHRLYPLTTGFDPLQHYRHLRRKACLYDVPETPLRISGPDSIAFLNKVFTRDIEKIRTGRAGYALACNTAGGISMEGVLMHVGADNFVYVQADGEFMPWLVAQSLGYKVTIEDIDSWVLQVQGPNSLRILEKVCGIVKAEFPYYSVTETQMNGQQVLISRSGWTGELGFEIYSLGTDFDGEGLWAYLLESGKEFGLLASDIGSMHIRRLEAGIFDYGTDIDAGLTPFDIGLGRLVDFSKPEFVGKSALMEAPRDQPRLIGITTDSGIPQRGDNVLVDNKIVGCITAGAYSPQLEKGIGFVRLSQSLSSPAAVAVAQIAGQLEGYLTTLPFFDRDKRIPRGLSSEIEF